jgi:hypothetical protein
MEDMIHFEPLDRGGKKGKQKMSNVNILLRKAKHLLYSMSISFKICNLEFLVHPAFIFIKKLS